MTNSSKAVFLSYASQDADAARRICESLRAAGVEVWFDQSELVGGDAWDQKIRKQIRECALFLPIVSKSTQGRREAYFRLEWKLADERTHLMAKGTPFLLPITIDETSDRDALVPDSFLAVQWTKAPAGETPPAFGARVQKILSKEPASSADISDARAEDRERVPSRASRQGPKWIRPVIVSLAMVVIVLAVTLLKRREPDKSVTPSASSQPLSEAQQLVAKAWQKLDSVPEPSRAELDVASEYCRRASALDSTDADVWALSSQIDTWYVAEKLDNSPERRESARTKATKALSLSPKSYEARLAHAAYLVRGEGFDAKSSFADEAEQTLRELLKEKPDEPHALLALGHLLRHSGRIEEAIPVFDHLALNAAWTAAATNAKAWMLYQNGRLDEALPVVRRSVAVRPFFGNLALQAYIATGWSGDLEMAKTALAQLPAADLREDYGAFLAVTVYWNRREPEQMMKVLNTVPREWIQSLNFKGPKGYWVGLAQNLAGNKAAAELAWRGALQLLEQRLSTEPTAPWLQALRGQLLARLGERAAAEKAFTLASQLGWDGFYGIDAKGWTALELEDADTALSMLERSDHLTWSQLLIGPQFDFLRSNPRFQAVLAAAERNPLLSPRAKPSSPPKGTSATEPTDKSVAVLAFANLSDDKANEYFSDGISEELLNVLAKTPGLKVSARTSAFYFKGKDTPIPEIGQKLGVAYIVEGSVRKQGEKVRITAQLIKAADGFHVWSETFTRGLKDVFAVQDEIAEVVAKNLAAKLGATARSEAPLDARAFELYLQGRVAWNRRNAEGLDRAESLFRQVLELAPDFARAHSALADVWMIRAIANEKLSWYSQRASSVIPPIEAEAQRAIELDPQSAEAHATLGFLRQLQNRPDEALRLLRRSVELNPNYATGHHWLAGVLFAQSWFEEGIAEYRRAVAIDPLSPRILDNFGWDLAILGRFSEALTFFDRALTLLPDEPQAVAHKAITLAKLGRRDEARALAGKIDPRFRMMVLSATGEKAELSAALTTAERRYRVGLLCALGRYDEALNELDPDDIVLEDTQEWFFDSQLVPFHHDRRLRKVVAELGFEDVFARALAWQAAHPPEKADAKK